MTGTRATIVAAVIFFAVFLLAWYFTGQVGAQGEKTGGGNTTPAKAPGTQPNAPGTQPKTPSPSPPKATPSPKSDGALLNAGAPKDGPVPKMPGGRCPEEYPRESGGACFR